MADKKISALTSASTPLAGTEVLPIVQSGATVKVAVSSLTAGRDVSMAGLTSTTSSTQGTAFTDTHTFNGPIYGRYSSSFPGVGGLGMFALIPYLANANQGGLTVQYQTGGAFADGFTLNELGNFTLSTGNLIPGTAAKGINFTANTPAAGMTSQLLNWYEEGTWTPSVTAAVGTITTVGAVAGTYTKVGRLCTLTFDVAITVNGTGASSINMAGAPFTALTSSFGCGSEVNLTGQMLNVNISTGAKVVNFAYYNATYPGANGVRLRGTIAYPV